MTCKVCNKEAVFVTTHNLLGLVESSIFQCSTCKTLFRDPLPSEKQLFEYYSKRDGRYNEVLEQKMAINQSNWLNDKLKKFGYLKNDYNYFEFGCGRGWLVKCMKNLGYNSFGLDPDSNSVSWGKTNLDINISQGFLDIYSNVNEFKSEKNLIISMMHVLEHLTNPSDVLKYLSTNFENHLLYFEVPDGKFEADVLKLDTLNCNSSGQHFFSFTEEGIISLLENRGYDVIVLEKFGNQRFWKSYLRSMNVWGIIETKYKYWRDVKFSFFEIFLISLSLSFKTMFYWITSKIEDLLFRRNSRLDLPVIRILAKSKLK